MYHPTRSLVCYYKKQQSREVPRRWFLFSERGNKRDALPHVLKEDEGKGRGLGMSNVSAAAWPTYSRNNHGACRLLTPAKIIESALAARLLGVAGDGQLPRGTI